MNTQLISTFRSIGFPNRPFGVYDIQLCPDTLVSQDSDCVPDTIALVANDNYFMPQWSEEALDCSRCKPGGAFHTLKSLSKKGKVDRKENKKKEQENGSAIEN